LGNKFSASTERYSHLSGEETLETGAAISKKDILVVKTATTSF